MDLTIKTLPFSRQNRNKSQNYNELLLEQECLLLLRVSAQISNPLHVRVMYVKKKKKKNPFSIKPMGARYSRMDIISTFRVGIFPYAHHCCHNFINLLEIPQTSFDYQ